MFRSFFKKNHPDNVNVWTKKSMVRFGRKKTALFEITVQHTKISIITNRDWYFRLNENPEKIHEFLEAEVKSEEVSQVLEMIESDGFYLLNGKQIIL